MLYPPHLTHAQLEQSGRFDLRPLTFEHQRHHLQHVPITLTHQNPVFLHPSLTNRTFLPAEERTLLPADDNFSTSPLHKVHDGLGSSSQVDRWLGVGRL